MAEAAGIFVSHAHEDNAWCRTFVQALRQGGATVWYDEHNLGYGVLGEEIERELKARPIFLVILSPASVGSTWVRRETNAAISLRDQSPERVILPVVAEKTEIPLFWQEYKRVTGPGDSGITATEAAGRVIHTLGIVPASTPAAPAPPVGTETAVEANIRGNGLYAQKRYEEALSAYDQALTLDLQNAEFWNNKGAALHYQKRYEEALSAYEQALTLDPQHAVAWNNKGAALNGLKRYEETLLAYEQAVALDPKFTDAWIGKGNALNDLGRYEEALSAYEQAVALDPQHADVWYSKGVTLQNLGRYEEALSAYERVVSLNPQDSDAWTNKVAVFRLLGRGAEAQEAERRRDLALQHD